eukprot:948100-Pleurochrysis_carterae.AAC.1
MPAKSERAALCCAGAEPAERGIAELEYGNPLDLGVLGAAIANKCPAWYMLQYPVLDLSCPTLTPRIILHYCNMGY